VPSSGSVRALPIKRLDPSSECRPTLLKELKRWRNRANDGMSHLASRWLNHSETNTRSISPLTQDLVRDVNVTAPRIPSLWEHIERI
jgi:hypothetical protein